jgi:hypothetical protein
MKLNPIIRPLLTSPIFRRSGGESIGVIVKMGQCKFPSLILPSSLLDLSIPLPSFKSWFGSAEIARAQTICFIQLR